MSKEEVKKENLVRQLAKEISDFEKVEEVKQLIKNDMIYFAIDDVKYRVRKATQAETQELVTYRRKKYLEYVDDETMLFRKEWVKKYKAKGIDIAEMEDQIGQLQSDIENQMIKLAQTSEESRIEDIRSNIIELQLKQATISVELRDLMSHSIENNLDIEVNAYYTYLVFEKETEPDKWEKVFKTYKDFQICEDSKLINKSLYYVNYLIYEA